MTMQEPKYTTHNIDDSIPMKTNKSSFKGKVKATFTQLVALFGKPHYIADPDEKVNWWWAVEFADGTIATIYYNNSDRSSDSTARSLLHNNKSRQTCV